MVTENDILDTSDNAVDPKILAEVWKRRAEHIARVPEEKESGRQIQLLVFRLGYELYAIEADYVFDIRPASEITLVPRVPDWVVGVANIRGKILSVIDLLRLFNLPSAQPGNDHGAKAEGNPGRFQVLVESPDMEVILLVDEVLSVEPLSENRIENYAEILGEMRPEYIMGTIPYVSKYMTSGKSILVILKLAALLKDKRLIIQEQVI